MSYVAIGAVFAMFALFAATAPIADGDAFWIAAAGRDMLATGHVPTTNAWSFADATHPWIMHEWLFGAPYARGLGALGPAFFALASLAFLTGAVLLVASESGRLSRHALTPALLTLVAVTCFGKRLLTPRPSGATLLLALGMLVASSREELTWRRAALLVALEWIWANAHGSFPLGIGILVTTALVTRTQMRRRLAVTAAAALVTVVNPYGLRLHGLVASYFRGDADGTFAFIHAHIAEFAPLWKNDGTVLGAPELVGLGLAFAATIAGLVSRTRAHRVRGAFAAALGALAVLHIRHAEQFGLLACVLLAPVVDGLFDRIRLVAPLETARARHVAIALAPGLGVALVAFALTDARRSREAWIGDGIGGPSFAAIAKVVPDGGKAFVPFDASGVLLWLAAPRGVRVLYDERNDCYRREIAEAQYALEHGATDPARILAEQHVENVLTREGSRLARALERGRGWSTVAHEGEWVLLELERPASRAP